MFTRTIEPFVLKRAQKMPVIAILGPRQSGKTTLVKTVFKNHIYISLENYEEREIASTDPRRFLEANNNGHGIILDEIQHVPQLLSYLQTFVDQEHRPGYIVITGSQNILVNEAISQTLAGRIAIFTLLPFSIQELSHNSLLPEKIEQVTVKGCYPRIYAYNLEPTSWYLDYIETYVERDVRQISMITNLSEFRRFIRLCAGRIGQLLNVDSLAIDCGISVKTAKSWLSILEASYIIFLLQPHYKNFSKRLIKSPKLYFYDTGLACALLGIESAEQLDINYLRGNLIESLIISEIFKHYYNNGERPHHVYFWRNQTGHEIDCIIQRGNELVPIEIKAGKTVISDFFKGLDYWTTLTGTLPNGYIIYAGEKTQERSQGTVISWKNIEDIFKKNN